MIDWLKNLLVSVARGGSWLTLLYLTIQIFETASDKRRSSYHSLSYWRDLCAPTRRIVTIAKARG
jgi:hypothetical protein